MAESKYPSFLEMDIPPVSFAEARVHILPVEMEKSVSYGSGTSTGPRAILQASLQLEAFDGKYIPGRVGMHTHEPIRCNGAEAEDDIEEIARQVGGVIRKDGIPVILGGEHTVTLGALKSFCSCGKKIGVVQFDAHADLRDTYEDNRYSHACVMRRVHEMGLPFLQIGIRSLSLAEDEFRRKNAVKSLDAAAIYSGGIPAEVLPDDFPCDIYITFDVDCFDASIMPATGTPEPGGLTWYQVMEILEKISSGRRICGCDIVELAPIPGMHSPDFTAAKLAYMLIGLAVKKGK